MAKTRIRRALWRADVRMLWRHGVAPIYILLMLMYIAALRLPIAAELRPKLAALLLMTDPATLSLFFMGAIVMYEKNQRVHMALYAGGIRARSYALSKCIVMGSLGLFVGCAVRWFGDPAVLTYANGHILWQTLWAGDLTALCVTAAVMALAGVFFTCVSLSLCAFARGLNGFLLLGVVAQIVFLLPAVGDLFFSLPAWAVYHPIVWLTRALSDPAGVLAWVSKPLEWIRAAELIFMLALAWCAACASVRHMLRSAKGVAL